LESDKAIEEYESYMEEIMSFKESIEYFLNQEEEFENKSENLKEIYELLGNAIASTDIFRIYESDIK
ncbi:hypothetical protein, partial [Staphylococcus aureus]